VRPSAALWLLANAIGLILVLLPFVLAARAVIAGPAFVVLLVVAAAWLTIADLALVPVFARWLAARDGARGRPPVSLWYRNLDHEAAVDRQQLENDARDNPTIR
jgi:hypothetical protein